MLLKCGLKLLYNSDGIQRIREALKLLLVTMTDMSCMFNFLCYALTVTAITFHGMSTQKVLPCTYLQLKE